MTNDKKFDLRLLKINEISSKSTDDVIYDIEYITMKSSNGANSLYLVLNNVDAYIDCNSARNKYLILAFTDKNREALKTDTELWDEIRDEIEIISNLRPTKYEKDFNVRPTEYEKDFIKIKFESDDDLPLGKILNSPVCVIIIIKSVFKKSNKYYLQVFLHGCFYEHEYDI